MPDASVQMPDASFYTGNVSPSLPHSLILRWRLFVWRAMGPGLVRIG